MFERDGVQLALLANGYESGFSTCCPPASRLILDLFAAEWSATSGPVRARLDAAFDGARRRFIEQAAAFIMPDADFPAEAMAEAGLSYLCWSRHHHEDATNRELSSHYTDWTDQTKH